MAGASRRGLYQACLSAATADLQSLGLSKDSGIYERTHSNS